MPNNTTRLVHCYRVSLFSFPSLNYHQFIVMTILKLDVPGMPFTMINLLISTAVAPLAQLKGMYVCNCV